MSKKIMKRSLALGALMAFVITGSAMAKETNYISETPVSIPNEFVITGESGSTPAVEADGKTVSIVGCKSILLDGNWTHNKDRNIFHAINGGTLTIGSEEQLVELRDTTHFTNTSIVFHANGSNINVNATKIHLENFGNAFVAQGNAALSINANEIYLKSDTTSSAISAMSFSDTTGDGKPPININTGKIIIETRNGYGIYVSQGTYNGVVSGVPTSGSVNINATGGEVSIVSSKGITILNGKDANNKASVDIESGIMNITSTEYGIKADTNAMVDITAGKTTINVINTNDVYAKGVYATNDGDVNIKGDVDITVNSKGATGVYVMDENSNVFIGGEGKTVNITAGGSGWVDGVRVFNGENGDQNINTNSEVTLQADTLEIKAISTDGVAVGIDVGNDTTGGSEKPNQVNVVARDTIITATSGIKEADEAGEYYNIGIVNYSQGIVKINDGNVTINAGTAISTRGVATTEININNNEDYDVKITGDISYSAAPDDATMVTKTTINLANSESFLKGNIVKTGEPEAVTYPVGVTLGLANGATWTTVSDDTGNGENNFVNALNINDGIVNVTDGTKIQVGVYEEDTGWSGTGTVVLENASVDQQVTLNKKSGEVTVATNIDGIDNMSDEQIAEALSDMQNAVVMASASEEAADYAAHSGKSALYDEVKIAMSDLVEGNTAALDKTVASANVSVNDMVAVGLMSWRAEMNDMNKRMGELRNANGEHGVWARMVRGESEYDNVKNQYNQYQLGYDEKLSVDKRWTVGAALSYTDAENSFAEGNGESTNKALSIYGSKLNNDGTFIDLIAKYARLENDFKTYSGMGDADYDTNGYSFSAEAGKRIQQGKGLWIEPQVELTYGKVSAVDYVTKNNVNVAQDGMDSLVGRIGFSIGKDIEKGNVYARASYLYDFDGETKAVLNGVQTLENDLGGGWWEVGVGANINLSKATYIYADVEKTFGGEVDTNWQWNLGVRYSF